MQTNKQINNNFRIYIFICSFMGLPPIFDMTLANQEVQSGKGKYKDTLFQYSPGYVQVLGEWILILSVVDLTQTSNEVAFEVHNDNSPENWQTERTSLYHTLYIVQCMVKKNESIKPSLKTKTKNL